MALTKLQVLELSAAAEALVLARNSVLEALQHAKEADVEGLEYLAMGREVIDGLDALTNRMDDRLLWDGRAE